MTSKQIQQQLENMTKEAGDGIICDNNTKAICMTIAIGFGRIHHGLVSIAEALLELKDK